METTVADIIKNRLLQGYRPYEIAKKYKYPLALIYHHEAQLDWKSMMLARQKRIAFLAAESRGRIADTSTVVDLDNKTKKCYSCNEVKPFDDYHLNHTRWHGLAEACKECVNSYMKDYHKRTYVKKGRPKAPPKYKPPKPVKPVYTKEQIKIKSLVRAANTRAIKKGLPHGLEWTTLEIPEYCPVMPWVKLVYDGSDKWKAASLDRIKPELGYVNGNVRIMSLRANVMKSASSENELVAFGEWAVKQQSAA